MYNFLFRGKPKKESDYYFFSQNWKDNCKDGFVYGSLIVSKDKYYICVSALCQINSCVNNGITSMIEVVPETVGQYTGLTDKNDKMIFEGDIMNNAENIVEFCGGGFCINGDSPLSLWMRTEVIGNRYDNPELLKGSVK